MNSMTDVRLKSKLYYYAAMVTNVYDGDTLTVDLDLGLSIWRHDQRLRLWKINTPEIRGVERPEGLRVRDYVRSLVLGKPIMLRTILDKRGVDSTEKYGRLLGEIILSDGADNLLNLNEHLLTEGMARPMTAGGVTVVEEETAAPVPRGSQTVTQILCPYCGEVRAIDPLRNVVAPCPNCLDGEQSIQTLLATGSEAAP